MGRARLVFFISAVFTLNVFFLRTFNDKLLLYSLCITKGWSSGETNQQQRFEKEVRELIAGGEDPYSVALFGITTKYLLESQTKIDFGFFELLDEVDVIAGSPSSFEGDEGPYLELLALYYLIARNTLTFSQGVNWMTHLTPDQRQVILSWPKNYVLSVFDLIIKDDLVLHKDLKTGKEYLMDYSPEDIGLPEDKLNIRLLTIIVPTEKNYLSAMPIFLPLDDLSLAKIKRSPSKQEYELALLIECSNF